MAKYHIRKFVGGINDGKTEVCELPPAPWTSAARSGQMVSLYRYQKAEDDGNVQLYIYELERDISLEEFDRFIKFQFGETS